MIRFSELLVWYSTLNPESVKRAVEYYDPDAYFKDPFNEVRGVDAIMRIFNHMFLTTENPRFIMGDQIMQESQAFVSWRFEFALRGKEYTIVGASHLKFNDSGLVIAHRDYWDAAEELFQKLPLVGAPIRWLRRQFHVPD
jgi:hypothetical protein